MDSSGEYLVLKLVGVFTLVLLNGFFVAAELALVKIRETQLQPLIVRGQRRAKLTLHLVQHMDAAISATQLGITLVSLGLGMVVAPVFLALLEPVFDGFGIQSDTMKHGISIAVGFFTNCYLLIVVGELTPKVIAIRRTLPVALWVASPLTWFVRITYPVVWVLKHSSDWILRQLGLEVADEAERTHSEEELRLLFAGRAGSTRLGQTIVLNALDLRRRVTREVMRPRQEIVVLDTEASIAACLDVAEKTRYSRFPLCEGGNLDKTLGVMHIKDLYAMRLKAKRGADLLPVARKLVYVPATARLEKLLQLLLERRLHMAIVVDEYGGTMGMATLENILEELVGQIQDEFDQEKPLLVKTGEQAWDVDGALPLRELSQIVGVNLAGDDVSTASGWVTKRLGGFPREGDVVSAGNCELHVAEVDGMRVAKLKVKQAPEKK